MPRAPKLMRMLLAAAFGGLQPFRVRDVSDILTTFLRVSQLSAHNSIECNSVNTPALLLHTGEIPQCSMF